MARQDPRRSWRRCQPQRTQECNASPRIEAVQGFIEQQHVRLADECPRQQHAATLTIRQRKELSRRTTCQPHLPQHGLDASSLRRRRGLQRKIRIVEAGEHDLRHVERRLVAHVPVLPLRTEVGNATGRKHGLRQHFAIAQVIAPRFAARRRGPHVTAQQLEQDRLAGTVRAEHQPALTGAQVERDIPQRPVPAEADTRGRDFDPFEPSRGRHGPAHAASHVQRSPSCATRRSSSSFCR